MAITFLDLAAYITSLLLSSCEYFFSFLKMHNVSHIILFFTAHIRTFWSDCGKGNQNLKWTLLTHSVTARRKDDAEEFKKSRKRRKVA